MVPPNPLPPDFSLPFFPLNLKRQYGLRFHIRHNGQQQQIHHELDVCCSTDTQEGDFLFLLDKKQVYIHEQAPDALLDEIADRCGKLLYPLQVRVSRQGHFKGIENGAAIRQRWQGARAELAQDYTGKIAQRILTSMDAALASEPSLADTISQDWLFSLLLPPLYHPYQNYQAAAELSLPIVANRQPWPYRLQLQAQPQHTSQGFIQIEATGVYTHQLPEAVRDAPLPLRQQSDRSLTAQGLASLTYQVYPHNGTLFSVTGSCSLQLPDGVEKVIDLQIYQLGEPDPLPLPHSTASIITDIEPVVKKKSWYALLQ